MNSCSEGARQSINQLRSMVFPRVHPIFILGALAFSIPGFSVIAAEKVTYFDGQAYLKVSDFARSLQMGPAKPRRDRKELGFAGEGRSLIVKVGSRQAIINGIRHWLSFPVMKKTFGNTVFISLIDARSTVIPMLNPASLKQLGKVKTVVFDPGHGGPDPGAIGPYGREKDYCLDLVKRTRKVLEGRGIKVVQNRLGDFFIPLSKRPSMTKNYEDPIFVSIHFNAASNRAASGIEVFSMPPLGAPSHGAAPDRKVDAEKFPNTPHEASSFVLAHTVHKALISRIDGFDRGVKRARFSVLRNASVPAIVVEGGFLSNREEAKRIHSTEWRQRFAHALADGIVMYMNRVNEKKHSVSPARLNRKPTDDFVEE